MQDTNFIIENMRRKRTAEALLRLTSGLINTTEIFVLFVLSLAVPLPGVTTRDKKSELSGDLKKIFDSITPKTIKKALYNLTFHGFVKRMNHAEKAKFVITQIGLDKLTDILPRYRMERPWDGHIYLIYYHLNPKAVDKRERLREFLRSIGCVLIHGGVWLHPYNKTKEIDTFLRTREIPGSVFVSRLTSDCMLGDTTMCEMLYSLFNIEDIENRYLRYIERYGNKQSLNKFRAAMEYLAILRDDPQLPFPLEPSNFPGKKASAIFQSATRGV